MFLQWIVVSTLSAMTVTIARANESISCDAARKDIVAEVLKSFPEIKALASSKEAAPNSKLTDLELYVDTFLPANKERVTLAESKTARDGVLQQITRMIDSPLVRHGGLDRKQAAPYVIDSIRVIVKATHPEARKAVKPKPPKPAEEKPVHVSLVQSDEGKALIEKWKTATDYKARRAACDEIVNAGTEGARVIIELGRDVEVRRAYYEPGALSQALKNTGEAAMPAIVEYLSLPDPTCGVDLTAAIAAWPPEVIDSLYDAIDRNSEKQMTTGVYWTNSIAHRTQPTERMSEFIAEAFGHVSPKVRCAMLRAHFKTHSFVNLRHG